ncbi:hypothetical protein ICJ33_00875 [Pseudomonas simiae]|uniref:phosphoribosyltransferase n=1 Tax=Pseudomonas simiae TaxID=321846 RepID=UPI001967D5AA|nr:hypothetical protein [Pseudomonas simiae]QRR30901.1 hypothetical protein ICJ33_00875 [Pseudomonas simiae]
MLILLTSPSALHSLGTIDQGIVDSLIATRAAGNPVGVVSNHAKPDWFDQKFAGKNVNFVKAQGRQSGKVVAFNADKFKLKPFDVLVLAHNDEDIQMGKNGGAVLVAAGWSGSSQVRDLGIRVDNAQQLNEVVSLTSNWSGQWWFSGSASGYSVMALADLSGFAVTDAQAVFGRKLTSTVKSGGSRLNALLAVAARSLLMTGIGEVKDLVWGVYPSSNSKNDDTETLSDFTHRLRTTVSRVRYAARGEPLFIRHSASPKRSGGGGGDRNDPSSQIQTIHLNPYYKKSNRLVNKNVILVDDCTTYGVSFGVAAAFLKKAGAKSVVGVAMGKFGDRLSSYDIKINSDPYFPVGKTDYTLVKSLKFPGNTNAAAQQTLHSIIV